MENDATNKEGCAENVRAIDLNLRQLCYKLRGDFDWLREKWAEFHELYNSGQERIDLLNTAASNFFYFLNCSMKMLCCICVVLPIQLK